MEAEMKNDCLSVLFNTLLLNWSIKTWEPEEQPWLEMLSLPNNLVNDLNF